MNTRIQPPRPDGRRECDCFVSWGRSWKEFETEWKASWRDASGRTLATATTILVIRAENAPAAFALNLNAPASAGAESLALEGTVRRMPGAYHGHGRWMRFAKTE